jgi:hypothetical protein
MNEREMLCHRLDQLRSEIRADSDGLRSNWQRSPFSSRWLLAGLAGVGALLFSARSAAMVRRTGVKPFIAVAGVKLLLNVLAKRGRARRDASGRS